MSSGRTRQSVESELVEGLASELRAGYDLSQRLMAGMIDELGLAAERCFRELERAEELAAVEEGEAAAQASAGGGDLRIAELEQELAQSQRQVEGLQRERSELAAQLAQLRQGLREMSAALAQKDRLLAQQQQAWSEEIRPLRQALEAIDARLAEPDRRPRRGRPAPAAAHGVLVQTEAGPAMLPDPVLESVIAQFALSQDHLGEQPPLDCRS